jgi:hypothetical protein
MLDDGVKGQGKEEDEVRVADISIHLLDALDRPSSPNGGPRRNVDDEQRIRIGGAAGDDTDPQVEPSE